MTMRIDHPTALHLLLSALALVLGTPGSSSAQAPKDADAGATAAAAASTSAAEQAEATPASAPGASEEQAAATEGPASAPSAESEAALAELMASTPTVEADPLNLQVYGFADFGILRTFAKGIVGDLLANPNFYVGNMNAYLAANLSHGFSSLAEVRFSFMPGGTTSALGSPATTTYAADSGSFGRSERWSGIVLQRVHLDYSYHSLLNLRVGQFLTPYGIWNVDHGSPTIIGIIKPYAIGEQLFPERQVGIEAFGSYLLGSTTLGYHVTASNGRGDFENIDVDKNKAFGGRLFVSTDTIGSFKFGVSTYGGRATFNASQAFVFKNGQPGLRPITGNQYDEFALAADVLWEWEGVRVQAEGMMSQVRYTERGRRVLNDTATGAPLGIVPDHTKYAWYALIGYRLPWYPIMPFFIYEQLHTIAGGEQPGSFASQGADAYNFGLNVRPIPSVAVKAQVIRVTFPHAPGMTIVGGQVAWAF